MPRLLIQLRVGYGQFVEQIHGIVEVNLGLWVSAHAKALHTYFDNILEYRPKRKFHLKKFSLVNELHYETSHI